MSIVARMAVLGVSRPPSPSHSENSSETTLPQDDIGREGGLVDDHDPRLLDDMHALEPVAVAAAADSAETPGARRTGECHMHCLACATARFT